jgi:hypothetical protein
MIFHFVNVQLRNWTIIVVPVNIQHYNDYIYGYSIRYKITTFVSNAYV